MSKVGKSEADIKKKKRGMTGIIADSAIDIEKAPRTTLSLSLTVEDKKFLKQYAAIHGKTVAGVVKDWVDDAKTEMM